jgi:hypothetical protein
MAAPATWTASTCAEIQGPKPSFHATFLERLQKANGTTANQVSWTIPTGNNPALPNLPLLALLAHNEWLENILADTSSNPHLAKVINNKPPTLKDACWDAAGVKHEEPTTLDPAAGCNQLFPIHENVRIAAGGPLAGDILKCQRKGSIIATTR